MNCLLIYANPNPKSLGHELRDAFLRGAKRGNHEVTPIDLYAERFNPVLSESEEHGATLPDVERYQTLIKKAQWLVFIFPVWWFRAPAILEGFFDRVFTPHFAYQYKTITKTFGIPIGLLGDKKALIISTYGSPGWAMRLLFFSLPWWRLKRGVLKFCGIKKSIHFPCYSAPYATPEQKEKWAKKLESLAEHLK